MSTSSTIMMNYSFCPYILGQLQGQLQKEGFRGSIFLVVCGLSALFVYLRLWRHLRPIGFIHSGVSSKMWYKRRAGPSAAPLPKVETYLESPGAKWKRSIVRPSNPPDPHWQSFSNLDRVVNPTFSSVLLSYTPSSLLDAATAAEKLKKSLADVLSVFYPLAGRLEVRGDGLVDLHCNNAGAVVLEVDVDEEFRAFGELRPMPALSGLNSKFTNLNGKGSPYLPDQCSPMPVLIVQITRFKCGSICLGANWHHTVADGKSGCDFMLSWAEVARGTGISTLPNHGRSSLLTPRNPLDPSLVNQHGYSTKSVTADSAQNDRQKPAVVEVVFIPKEKVDEIKAQVAREAEKYPEYAPRSENGEPGKPYTSVECFSAWVWRTYNRCRYENFKMQEDRRTRFFMFVDGRPRGLKLPRGYFGNVVCSACALTWEKELDSKPLIYAASLIRMAVDGVSGDYFRSLIDWVQNHGLKGLSKSEHVNSLGHDVAATFWSKFPLYRIDFGWGQPAFGARNSPPRDLIDGFSVMPSNTGKEGDIVVLLNLHEDRLERLRQDEAFRRLVNL